MIVAIAAVAVVLSLARFASTALERAATGILAEYGPASDPDLDVNDYRVGSITRNSNETWLVRFVRVAGEGPEERIVGVTKKSVEAARFNPWWSPPDLARQRTRPAAARGGPSKITLGGPVR